MKTVRMGVLAIALTLFPGAPALAQTGHDLFQQALVKEQVEGDLRAAIALYQRIVGEFSADRALAARALVQMGQCHEKQGNQEAQGAYRQVLEEYADQVESADQARARLAALNRPATRGEPAIQVRRLLGGRYPSEVDMEGGPTPDGRFLVRMDGGNFVLWNMATGESSPITDVDYEEGYPGFAIVSPDGRRIAYDWHRTAPVGGPLGIAGTELRVVGIDGSDPTTLHSDWAVYPGAWSQDGRHIAVTIHVREDSRTELAWISTQDGTKTLLWTFDYPARFHTRAGVSPDNRFVAVGFPVEEDSARFDISLIATDGSGIRPLVDHPADDRLIGWVPGTHELLFKSDRSGTFDLWAVRVGEDGAAGRPRPVKRSIGEMDPMGFTRDGSLFYSIYTLQFNLGIAPFDPATGQVQMEDFEPFGGLGSNMRPTWSPDGEWLAFVRMRPSPPGRGFGMKGFEEILYVRNLATGEERALAEHIAPATTGGPTWNPDGRSILVVGMPQTSSGGLDWGEVPSAAYRIDLASGEAVPLFEFPPAGDWWSRIGIIPTPDGRSVIYVHQARLVRRDLGTGRERDLYGDPLLAGGMLALSPDGSELVFGVNDPSHSTGYVDARLHEGGRLMIMPSGGGTPRELFRLEEPRRAGDVWWSPDGSSILFGVRDGESTTFLRVGRAGGRAERLDTAWDLPVVFTPSPDGRRIAFWLQENEAEVWVMENLVAALRETVGRE
jgi:Tol biopolymer transport system component